MPSNILAADVLFPHLTEKQSTDEKFTVVTDYLFMLLEQLRYTLANLGQENFNETEFESIGNVITEPVYVMLRGLEGEMASLSLTANSLDARVTNAVGQIAAVSVTANKINWLVKSGTSASDFTMTDRAINLVAENINLAGYVTFTSLSDQNTTTIINGGNLSACTISSSTFDATTDINNNVYGGMNLYCQTYSGIYQVGALNTDVLGNQCRVYLRSRSSPGLGLETVLKLYSETNASLEAEGMVFIGNGSSTTALVQIQAPTIKLYGNIYMNDTLVSAKTS